MLRETGVDEMVTHVLNMLDADLRSHERSCQAHSRIIGRINSGCECEREIWTRKMLPAHPKMEWLGAKILS